MIWFEIKKIFSKLERYRELETPYYYAYFGGWQAVLQYTTTIIMLPLMYWIYKNTQLL